MSRLTKQSDKPKKRKKPEWFWDAFLVMGAVIILVALVYTLPPNPW